MSRTPPSRLNRHLGRPYAGSAASSTPAFAVSSSSSSSGIASSGKYRNNFAGDGDASSTISVAELKASLNEVVDEVLFCEGEIARLRDVNARLTTRIEEYERGNAVKTLKQMLSDQQERFEREKKALQLQLAQYSGSSSSSSSSHPGTQTMTVAEAASTPRRASDRIRQLEQMYAEERTLREELESKTKALQGELEDALKTARTSSINSIVSKEEIESERDQRRHLREEFDRVTREHDAMQRELRAAEKRHEQLRKELMEVMGERDEANAARSEALRLRRDDEEKVEVMRIEMRELEARLSGMVERMREAERLRESAALQAESEVRRRRAAEEDLELFKTQIGSLASERDALNLENARLNERLDEALGERKGLHAELERAGSALEEAQRVGARLSAQKGVETRRAEVAEGKLAEAEALVNQIKADLQAVGAEGARWKRECDAAKDARAGLERELEISKRSNKALNDEMYSVLKMRDEASKEREEMARALQHAQSQIKKMEDKLNAASSARSQITTVVGNLETSPEKRSPPKMKLPSRTPPLPRHSSSSSTTTPHGSSAKKSAAAYLNQSEVVNELIALRRAVRALVPSSTASRLSPLLASGASVSANSRLLSDPEAFSDYVREELRATREELAMVDLAPTEESGEERRRMRMLESLRRRTGELEGEIRAVAAETGGAFETASKSSPVRDSEILALRRELRAKTQECEALKRQRDALMDQIDVLTANGAINYRQIQDLEYKLKITTEELEAAKTELYRARFS